MLSSLPCTSPVFSSPRETTSLREMLDKYAPSSDNSANDPTTKAAAQYMRGLIQVIVAKNGDILDQPFDESQIYNITEGLCQFLMGDLVTAANRIEEAHPEKKELTLADITGMVPDGIEERLAMDMRERMMKVLFPN